MTATLLLPPTEMIHLSGISWQTYEQLLQELGQQRRLRLTYYQGNLEIMTPSPEHERYKKLAGRFVETLAEELALEIEPLGSITLKRPKQSGVEPDECFYITNVAAVRGKVRFNPANDPAPDLVIEIDVTHGSQSRLPVYKELGVSEVWVYDGSRLSVYHLQGQDYVASSTSQFFLRVPILEIVAFLQQAGTVDYLALVRMFREWVRAQLASQG